MGSNMGGMMFVGAILVGVGIGMIAGNIAAGAIIGAGVGFILMGFAAPMGRFMKKAGL